MTYAKNKEEIDFAYKIRRAMNQSAEALPEATLERLAKARELALSKKKESDPSAMLVVGGVLAGNQGMAFNQTPWFRKLVIIVPLMALAFGLYGLYQHEQQQQINDLAEIDAAVLVDELPPDAYLDNGFNAYLNKDTQEKKTEE